MHINERSHRRQDTIVHGEADCKPIQDALDHGQGGPITLSPGRFYLNKPLELKESGQVIIGSGASGETNPTSGTIIEAPLNQDAIRLLARRTGVFNLRIVGKDSQHSGKGNGILVGTTDQPAEETYIDNVDVSGCGENGILLRQGNHCQMNHVDCHANKLDGIRAEVDADTYNMNRHLFIGVQCANNGGNGITLKDASSCILYVLLQSNEGYGLEIGRMGNFGHVHCEGNKLGSVNYSQSSAADNKLWCTTGTGDGEPTGFARYNRNRIHHLQAGDNVDKGIEGFLRITVPPVNEGTNQMALLPNGGRNVTYRWDGDHDVVLWMLPAAWMTGMTERIYNGSGYSIKLKAADGESIEGIDEYNGPARAGTFQEFISDGMNWHRIA